MDTSCISAAQHSSSSDHNFSTSHASKYAVSVHGSRYMSTLPWLLIMMIYIPPFCAILLVQVVPGCLIFFPISMLAATFILGICCCARQLASSSTEHVQSALEDDVQSTGLSLKRDLETNMNRHERERDRVWRMYLLVCGLSRLADKEEKSYEQQRSLYKEVDWQEKRNATLFQKLVLSSIVPWVQYVGEATVRFYSGDTWWTLFTQLLPREHSLGMLPSIRSMYGVHAQLR